MEEKITAWVVRDKDGFLWESSITPQKSGDIWITSDFNIGKNNFPQAKLEDKEPTKIESIKIENVIRN